MMQLPIYGHITKGIKSKKYFHSDVYSCTIYNSQVMENQPGCPSTEEWINKGGFKNMKNFAAQKEH